MTKKLKKLIKLNWQGDAISSYGDIIDHFKVVLSNNGTVFVCDEKGNVIEEVLEDCSRGDCVEESVSSWAIFWCSEK